VFSDHQDRHLFSKALLDSSVKYGLRILAYCWMTNHTHVIAIPQKPDSLAKTFRRVHSIYALEFNRKYGLSGYLWQNRFYSCPLDEQHLWSAIRYVERNPVRAGLTSRAEDYPWSSALSHCCGAEDPLLDPDWRQVQTIADWSAWLASGDDKADEQIRSRTISGIPCGDDAFVSRLEQELGRILRIRRPGPTPE
jgi:putative transposase